MLPDPISTGDYFQIDTARKISFAPDFDTFVNANLPEHNQIYPERAIYCPDEEGYGGTGCSPLVPLKSAYAGNFL